MKRNMIGLVAMVVMGLLSGPAWGQPVTVDDALLKAAGGRVRNIDDRVKVVEKTVTEYGTRLGSLEVARKAKAVTPAPAAPPSAPPAVVPPAAPSAPPPAPSRGADEERIVRDALREYAGARYGRVLDPSKSRAQVAGAHSHLTDVSETYCRSHAGEDVCREVAHVKQLAELRLNSEELAAVTQATIMPPPESFVETYGGQCLMGGTLGALAAGVASATAGTMRGKARNGASDAATTGLVTAGVTGVVFALVNASSDVRQWGAKAALAAGCAAGGGMAEAGGDYFFRPRPKQRIVVSAPVR